MAVNTGENIDKEKNHEFILMDLLIFLNMNTCYYTHSASKTCKVYKD